MEVLSNDLVVGNIPGKHGIVQSSVTIIACLLLVDVAVQSDLHHVCQLPLHLCDVTSDSTLNRYVLLVVFRFALVLAFAFPLLADHQQLLHRNQCLLLYVGVDVCVSGGVAHGGREYQRLRFQAPFEERL